MEAMRAEAFAHLKPYCVQLTREHTRTNISQLFTALQSINVVFLQDLQEYVIFPLRVILKHPKKCSQDLYLDLFSCMEYVLGHTRVSRWDLFQDIFNTATNMLSCPTDQSKVAKLTEELKIAIIQTVRTLVKSSDQSVVQQLFTVLCLPLLGHAVSLLLNIAEAERARNLRVLAMECLLDLSQADSKYSPCLKADIGSIFASFLPGISVGLCKIITGDTKQGFAVTAKAIYVWMRIVSLVMDDKLLDVYRQKQAKQSSQTGKSVDPRLEGLVVARDPKWITTTGDNLAILVKQVSTVRSHSNWRVRLGLVECAEHLLLHCTCSMKGCVPGFLEILVSLIGDDYTKVSSGSHHALELFSQSQASDQQRQLTELLEENLHKLATSLPRQIQTAEEEDKLSLLNLLNGYLSLLGSKMKSLLLSLPHLRRLSLALVQILELECSDVKIVEERTTITGHGTSAISGSSHSDIVRPRKYFKHFTNDKILEKIQGVCHLLGYYGDIHLLVDHFLDIFHESSMFKMQATLVINEILLGTTGETVCLSNMKNGRKWHKHSQEELDTVIRMLVDEYLNPVNFDLPTAVQVKRVDKSLEQQLRSLAVTTTSHVHDLTAAQMNRNILQISLYIEGLANFSKVLGTNFSPLLMKVLYPLLEKLGDNTAFISNTAYLSLCDITHSCRYRSIDQLIRDNSDYLINDISLRLRRLDMNRRCPLVLKVMLQYCSAELLPLISDTVKDILGTLDDHYDEDSVLFMGVLNELTKAVVRWFPASDQSTQEPAGELCQKQGTSDGNKHVTGPSTKHKGTSDSGSDSGEGQCGKESNVNQNNENCMNENRSDKSDGNNDIVLTNCDNSGDKIPKVSESSSSNTCEETKARPSNSKRLHLNVPKNHRIEALFNELIGAPMEEMLGERYTDRTSDDGDTNDTSQKQEGVTAEADVSSKSDAPDSVAEKLKKEFSDLLKAEKEELGEVTEEDLENFNPSMEEEGQADDADEEDPDQRSPPPVHVEAVKEVMLRCKQFLTAKNPRLRLLVLETVANVCVSLQPYQNELLPLIHQVWPSFSLCFSDEEKMITIKALDVLHVVTKSSGDFVRHRVTKDVLPRLASFLNSQAEISIHAGSAYQYTVNYKLQTAILKHVSSIARLCCMSGSDLDILTSSCVQYLSAKQPGPLQNVCYECCRELIQIDADLLWLKLCQMYCPRAYLPPDTSFKHIPALKQTGTSNHYTTNVTLLMLETGLL